MSALVTTSPANVIEQVIAKGDLAKLTAEERVTYYVRTCESLGLNPLTKPFEYITLNGKLTLYARKDATEQLRKIHGVSLMIVGREMVDDVYIVTARATMRDGRTDESIGAVAMGGLKGEARANAIMKAETKAKRRVTLSACGLGILDETETDSIANAHPVAVEHAHAALPPATTISEEQIETLTLLLDALAAHQVTDEQLLKGIQNITKQDVQSLEVTDLATLTAENAEALIGAYSRKLDTLDAKGGR